MFAFLSNYIEDTRSGWPSFVGSSLPGGQELEQKLPNHFVGTPVYQVSPEQAALNGQNNRSEDIGKWTNPIGIIRRLLNSYVWEPVDLYDDNGFKT